MAAATGAVTTVRSRFVAWSDRHARLLLVTPALLAVAAVALCPLGYSLWASFRDEISFPGSHWAGLAHFRDAVEDPDARAALTHTAILCGAAVALEVVLGLLLALSVSAGRRWRRALIPLLVLPMFASAVTAGQFWRLLLDPKYGPVDFLLGKLVGHHVGIDWTAH